MPKGSRGFSGGRSSGGYKRPPEKAGSWSSSNCTNRAGSYQISSDGRSAHEYHGKGELNSDGSVNFNDSTESGKHSHTVHKVEGGNATQTYHRPEGDKK